MNTTLLDQFSIALQRFADTERDLALAEVQVASARYECDTRIRRQISSPLKKPTESAIAQMINNDPAVQEAESHVIACRYEFALARGQSEFAREALRQERVRIQYRTALINHGYDGVLSEEE